jgi:hypothetical protein
MKPDWDSLAADFANSEKVLIADVDCTGAGEPLCERFGIQGFPTIKYFEPPDNEGEDYEGERSLEELKEFASQLGPGCSAAPTSNCSPEERKELDILLATPAAELETEIVDLKQQIDTAENEHEELVKSLQQQYEESEATVEATKKSVKPRLKLLRAAMAASPATAKDEV